MTRYCGSCGARMGFGRPKLEGYDEFTGKPWFTTIFRCPNARIWKIGHSSLTVTNNPRHRQQLGEE